MTTENETWQGASSPAENTGADREGNQTNKENGYARVSYNRDGNARPHRPRFNPNAENARPQRAYSSDRPYRPRFNPNAAEGDRPQRPYNQERSYNQDRPYRPRFNPNAADGERPQQRTYNQDRPYRPKYNAADGDRPQRPYNQERSYNQDRPYRPRFNPNAAEGERPQRPYNQDRPAYGNQDRSLRPRYNSNAADGERPQRPYGNPGRPRFNGGNNGGGNRPYGSNPRRRTPGYDPNAKYSKKKQIEYKEQFVDPNEPIRLNKFLANAGVCSRREADEYITAGVVSVNGQVVNELGTKIKRGDEVKFHDQVVNIERKIYVLLNKPKDTVTTSDDPQARRTVMDLVKDACTWAVWTATPRACCC